MHEATIVVDLHSSLALMSEALQKAEEHATAGQLALELMHEIRNPLEAVGNLTYLAQEEAENPEAVRAYLRHAEEQLATLNSIASRTLGFARASDSPQQVRLATLADAALRIHQRTMQSKQIHLVRDLSEDLVAEVYTTEILQVLSNLIVNSIDALPREGTLYLRLKKRRSEIHFVVADNGHGIPEEHRNRVFEPFFTTKNNAGTGLGLALSKRIVEHNRGKISLRSSIRPGRTGTTFKISLPT